MAQLVPNVTPPKPQTADPRLPFWLRLQQGFHSWLSLLGEWDYRLPIGSMRFLGRHFFVLNAPHLVRRVLVEESANFPKHPYTAWTLAPLIGQAIFSVNGEPWRQQRRLVDQAFQAVRLQQALPAMQAACAASISRLEPQADGGALDIDQEITLLTGDVILRTLASVTLSPQEGSRIVGAFAAYQERAARALIWRLLRCPRGWFESGLRRAAEPIRNWMAAMLAARLVQPHPPADLLQGLIEATDPMTGARFSLDELVDQACFLFLAGHETSASALAMAIYLLSVSPELQGKLRQERQAVLAGEQRPLGFQDLRAMEWHIAVFNETLRLYPPVSFLIRETNRATELEGQRCPLGSLLTISPWLIHRHNSHWDQPDRFCPERFLVTASLEEQRLAKEAFLPYGLGQRKCPGAAFAQQEAVLVLAELLNRFAILPADGHRPDLVGRLTLRSRNGIWVRLRRRDER
jgi:cytochrome P450